MKLKQIMTRNVETVGPDTTLQEAAEKMASLDVGFLPVMQAKVPVGVVTDRDITVRAVARGDDPRQTRVSQVMTTRVEAMSEDSPVEEAARLMREKRLRRLLVEDINRRIVGVVALADLALEVPDQRLSGETLESVSDPETAETR
jgi:CBS domain-containing protein